MPDQVTDNYPGKSKPMTNQELKAKAIEQYEQKTDTKEKTEVYDFPTEIVELPSRGYPYDTKSPLSKGTIEMKYMTAKEEDILTNQSYIKNGVVLDKLFKALIVSPIEYNDLLVCDKNAIMIAARILGYGKDYPIKAISPSSGEEIDHTVDLTQLKEREIDWSLHAKGKNEFEFQLPYSKRKVIIKLLTQRAQNKIDAEIKGLEKVKKKAGATTLLKHLIVSIDGDTDGSKIRNFVDQHMLAIDSRALRNFYKSITPDIEMKIDIPDGESGDTFRSQVNLGLDFFWPDAEV